MKKEYYVYVLIDPRDNQIFYVGKGKGLRYKSHLKQNIKTVKNIHKYWKIKEIQDEGLEVKTEILFPYLDEKTSLELEKIIIYKLGRQVFSEGELTNFVPGGDWKPGDTIFYEDKINTDFDLSRLDFVSQERFLDIKKTSNIIHLNEINPKFNIYTYNIDGVLLSIDSINCFFKRGRNYEIFEEIINIDFPIYYVNNVYSKFPIEDFYFSKNLPRFFKYVFDSDFLKEFDKKLEKNKDFTIELKNDKKIHLKVNYTNGIITLISYDKTGIMKSYNNIRENDWFNNYNESNNWVDSLVKSEERYDNGILKNKTKYHNNSNLKSHIEYLKNGNIKSKSKYGINSKQYSRITFYNNGNKKSLSYNFNNKKHHKRWYINGNKELEYIENKRYIFYDDKGVEKDVDSKKYKKLMLSYGLFDNKELYYTEHITKENLTKEQLNEQVNSTKDWESYYKNSFKNDE